MYCQCIRPVWWKGHRPRVRPKKGTQTYQAVYNQNPKLSIGRIAQIHDYHMLHVAGPAGVCAWSRILCQFGLPSVKAAEDDYIMTQACLAAAIGKKKPAH